MPQDGQEAERARRAVSRPVEGPREGPRRLGRRVREVPEDREDDGVALAPGAARPPERKQRRAAPRRTARVPQQREQQPFLVGFEIVIVEEQQRRDQREAALGVWRGETKRGAGRGVDTPGGVGPPEATAGR